MRIRALLIATTTLFALACSDAGTTPVDAGSSGTPSVECTPYTAGLVVTQNTVLCGGTVSAPVSAGTAAIVIAADDVTLTCLDTILEGDAAEQGTNETSTVGILINGRANVTVKGCGARNYRYGLVAYQATDLVVENTRFDDNHHQPGAGWVQDTVQGGGLRLELVNGGRVSDSSFARNWNGIELRGTRNVTIEDNAADHCSNTGATLVDAHDNILRRNDMSYAIRGERLSYPIRWYGLDTRDSAGVIIDAGSSGNRIEENNFTYGGDGIFIRSIIGACAENNVITGNDTSFSPHNAIECWCDGNVFTGNVASDSHYGIWLGGTDDGLVRDNLVERNLVDGISIQIGENRRTLIEDNLIAGNGRAGILLTGREIQAWQSLTHVGDVLANSSQILVQHNTFDGPASSSQPDVFVAASRGVYLVSNCAQKDGIARDLVIRQGEGASEVVTFGGCPEGDPPAPPVVTIDKPAATLHGGMVNLVAKVDPSLKLRWLVQPSGMRFPTNQLPTPAFAGEASPALSLYAGDVGIYDAFVLAIAGDPKATAAFAATTYAILPSQGLAISDQPSRWSVTCDLQPTCKKELSAEPGIDGDSLHLRTDAPYAFRMTTPTTKDLNIATTAVDHVAFAIRAENKNEMGWQVYSPIVAVGDAAGHEVRCSPAANLLSTMPRDWIWVDVPLSGGNGFTCTGTRAELTSVDYVTIESDTWGYRSVDLWIDAVTLIPPPP